MAKPKSKFVVLFTGRSGSSYLTSLLNSHPNVICEGEMLAQIIRNGEPIQRQLGWSRTFFEAGRSDGILAVGYKTKMADVADPEGFRGMLQELGIRVVHLVRRNLVKQVVSAINAERLFKRTGEWNIRDERSRLGAFSIAPGEFDVALRNRVAGETQLSMAVKELAVPTLCVGYEDLLYELHSTLDGLFSFLEIPPAAVGSEFKKHTPDSLRDVVLNLAELKAVYAGTEYEAMFDEG